MALIFHSLGKRAIRALAVKCSNDKCDWVGTVGTLEEHEPKCEFALVTCKFRGLGCKEKLTRSDKARHEEDDKLHLYMAIETIAQLKKEKTQIILKDGGSIIFKVEDCAEMKKKGETYRTNSFYTSSAGYRVGVNVSFSEGRTHISTHLAVYSGDHDDKLSWPFIGCVTFTLLNQLENINHYNTTLSIAAEDQLLAGYNIGYRECFPCSELGFDPVKNTQYLKDNALYFRVSIKVADHNPWLQCNMTGRI